MMASFAQLNKMTDEIAVGKYAIIANDGETAYFFEIAEMKNGSHRIYRLVGSPGDYKRRTMNIKWQLRTLTVIGDDPTKAMQTYGFFSKFCGACSSPLTHKRSLDCGMGPKCAPKYGVKW